MKKLSFIAALVFVTLVSGCATIYNPATGRKEMVFINTTEEVNIGSEIEKAVLRKYKLSEDSDFENKVDKIGKKIAAASDRKDLKYRFKVVESKDVNAFALPGGSVFVTTGLLKAAENDDELANVIGHEIGHISARHPVKKLESQLGYSFLVDLAYMLDTRSPAAKNRIWEDITMATNITFRLITFGYGRRDEISADKLGALYAEKAGYDPHGAISFLKKLKKEENSTPEFLVFLRSHPYAKDRIIALEEWLKR